MGVNWLNPDSSSLINAGANFGPTTIGRAEYWRLLASIFLHAGIFHIALNLYALIGFGPMAESALGRWRFVFIFILSGVVGGLSSILANPITTSIGCSGANLGIIGALMLSSWLKRADLSVRLSRPQLLLLAIFLLYSLALGLGSTYIDNGAHLGGFITGILASLLLTDRQAMSKAYFFNSAPAKALALTAVVPVLIAIDQKRIENNNDVKCCIEHMDAIALLKEKKYFHGIEKLDAAHSFKPGDASVLADRARALVEIGHFDKALNDINKVIEQHPKDRLAIMNKASIYHKMQKDDLAIAEMDKAIALEPKATGFMAMVNGFKNMFSTTAKQEDSTFYNNRAWFKLASGELESAVDDCNQAIKINRSSSTAYDTRSVAYYLLGKYQLADQDLVAAIRRNSKDGAFYYHRTLTLIALGKADDAKAALAKYRELDYKPEAWEPKVPANIN
jgi:membrane associated rhomboid family serine protease/Tfp pilus assembly protein PilF